MAHQDFAIPEEPFNLPVLPVRGVVVFPRVIMPLLVGRPASLMALREAEKYQDLIFVTSQVVASKEEISPEDLYGTGTICKVSQMGMRPDGRAQVLVEGITRAKSLQTLQTEPFYLAQVQALKVPEYDPIVAEAALRNLRNLFDSYLRQFSASVAANDTLLAALDFSNPDHYADMVASQINLGYEEKQQLLETLNPVERIQKVLGHLSRELEIARIERKIQREVNRQIVEPHRTSYLKEQLKAIYKELGELEPSVSEQNELYEKLKAGKYPDYVRQRIEKELERLRMMAPMSPEATVVRTYVDWLLDLPWEEEARISINLKRVKKVLDEDHYGLEEVKERILEHLAVRKLSRGRGSEGAILGLLGPPGVGKTSLGQSIARAIRTRFVRASLGGIRDEAEIRGHRRTYVGALPGKIIQGIRKAEVRNPVFLLDEVDKIGIDFRGDPASALLEALDPDQNSQFTDHYIELPFDLSGVFFVCTANVDYTIPPALLDRMEMIHLSGYTEEEKVEIARRHLIPKVLKKNGLVDLQIRLGEEALREMIRKYTRESGVRHLERRIAKIARKVAARSLETQKKIFTIKASDLGDLLGPPDYVRQESWQEWQQAGIAFGLAWTSAGGVVLPIETSHFPGKGEVILTGMLGEVMRESARAALSYLRAHSEAWGISPGAFQDRDLHIHIPEGALPKDGPSAGLALMASILSAFLHMAPRPGVAMTGEITLSGKVLPVGGLKEKVLAAYREGFRHVILPELNKKDFHRIPEEVKKSLSFSWVSEVQTALNFLFPRDEGTLSYATYLQTAGH
jgi:ATP-dependent Lon protease